ncbi:chaperone protein DnaK-like [Impatiens glandulifera]|uniref:chaperone protein DnaK-like n=1 Tax=Impatiens glandulifera TaxID=253017 RepID=UPI001FB165FA|nr:chaperone protein DnaK-like [Impatiens glandulifera]
MRLVKKDMDDVGLQKSQMDKIVLASGSARIPKVQQLLNDYFNGERIYVSSFILLLLFSASAATGGRRKSSPLEKKLLLSCSTVIGVAFIATAKNQSLCRAAAEKTKQQIPERESKYVVVTEAFKEAIWLRAVLFEIGFLDKNVVVFSDSQFVIQLCKNPIFHDRTKHIDVRFHYIRDIIEKGIVKLEKIPSEFNPADMNNNQSVENEDYDEKLKEVEAVYQRSSGALGVVRAGPEEVLDDNSRDEL